MSEILREKSIALGATAESRLATTVLYELNLHHVDNQHAGTIQGTSLVLKKGSYIGRVHVHGMALLEVKLTRAQVEKILAGNL